MPDTLKKLDRAVKDLLIGETGSVPNLSNERWRATVANNLIGRYYSTKPSFKTIVDKAVSKENADIEDVIFASLTRISQQ